MKRVFQLLIAMLVCVATCVSGQDRKEFVYRAKVVLMDGKKVDGYLAESTDSTIRIVAGASTDIKIEIQTGDIKTISLRQRKAPARGLLFGFAGGAAFGALIGYISYDSPSCGGGSFCLDLGPETSALAGGVLGGLLGGILGTSIGSSFKIWHIQGSAELYRQFRSDLQVLEEKKTK